MSTDRILRSGRRAMSPHWAIFASQGSDKPMSACDEACAGNQVVRSGRSYLSKQSRPCSIGGPGKVAMSARQQLPSSREARRWGVLRSGQVHHQVVRCDWLTFYR